MSYQLSRRDLIKGGLVGVGSLVLPISAEARELTDVDRILLHELQPSGTSPEFLPHGSYVLSRVEVDERLRVSNSNCVSPNHWTSICDSKAPLARKKSRAISARR